MSLKRARGVRHDRTMNDSARDGSAQVSPRQRRRFFRLALLTVTAVYFLIAVGGIVRATGAGMGCPDWPQCFDRWIPPTDVSQLPTNYQEIYAERGYADTEFNAVKTWTEYVNRLVGALIGIFILLTAISARHYRRGDPPVFWWSVVAFILVGFQGWLGSVVVASNLATWMVTLHMLVALVIVCILIYVLVRSQRVNLGSTTSRRALPLPAFVAAFALVLLQTLIGTQVRERIDHVSEQVAERSQWIAETGLLTLVHRSFSLVVAAVVVFLLWKLRPVARHASAVSLVGRFHRPLVQIVLATLVLEVLAGIGLFYFAVPAALQPVHLLLAAILVGAVFALWVVWRSPEPA